MPIILGGLGGGGDVGLALILAESSGLSSEAVWASFAGCNPERASRRGHRAVWASIVEPYSYHNRNFEWALRASGLAERIYRVCLWASRDTVLEGLKWLASQWRPECSIHADIGGDGILTGYETSLGSYRLDTLARAAIALAMERGLWSRGVIAAGGVGLEGSIKRLLSMEELAASLLYYDIHDAILGAYLPSPRETIEQARRLLQPTPDTPMLSAMLPLYIGSLEQAETVEVVDPRTLKRGRARIDPWSRIVYLLDAEATCKLSPLCTHAKNGWITAVNNPWKRPEPPGKWKSMLQETRRMGPARVMEKLYQEHALPGLKPVCTG
ncbi:MAG: DUF1152 domain-containing protein [Desulfurococcales archaeon]|nr:DUF1152 domain-containing protein [Desulfurococcales archaeon]